MPQSKSLFIKTFLDSVTYEPLTGRFLKGNREYKMDSFRLRGFHFPKKQAALYCMTRDKAFIRGMFPDFFTSDVKMVIVADNSLPLPARFAIYNLRITAYPVGTALTMQANGTWTLTFNGEPQ